MARNCGCPSWARGWKARSLQALAFVVVVGVGSLFDGWDGALVAAVLALNAALAFVAGFRLGVAGTVRALKPPAPIAWQDDALAHDLRTRDDRMNAALRGGERKRLATLPDTPARFCNRAGPMGGGCADSWHVGGNYGSHVCRNPAHHDGLPRFAGEVTPTTAEQDRVLSMMKPGDTVSIDVLHAERHEDL